MYLKMAASIDIHSHVRTVFLVLKIFGKQKSTFIDSFQAFLLSCLPMLILLLNNLSIQESKYW